MRFVRFEHRFFVGIDIGQINDWTAISVIESIAAVPVLQGLHHSQIADAKAAAKTVPTRLDLVHLERIPLGTVYPRQVEMICRLLREPSLRDAATYLDATGVGFGPFQMLRAEGVRNLHGIKITGSAGRATRTADGWNVGKAELVNAVQIEMQTGRLQFAPGLEDAPRLAHEMKQFRSSRTPLGHQTFNARDGQNDDLVLSLSYAVFGALLPRPVTNVDLRFVA